MASVLRLGALLLGFVGGLVLLAVLSTVLPGAWLPLAYSWAAIALVRAYAGRSRPCRWWAIALVLDVFYLWSLSVDPAGLHGVPGIARLLAVASAVGAAVATFMFAMAARQRHRWLWGLLVPSSIVAFVSSSRGGSSPFVDFYTRICGLSLAQAHTATLLTRKSIHFTFYGTVGLVAAFAARALGMSRRRVLAFGLLYPLLLACFDELRQSGYQNRTGTPWDVLLDMAGAAVFLALFDVRTRQREQVKA